MPGSSAAASASCRPRSIAGTRAANWRWQFPNRTCRDWQFAPGNSAVRRLWTGAQWAEGPAWSSQGQYLVFSDVTGNTQYRYIWEDGRVTAFRRPSNNTNGNSIDFEGRQLSCEDFNRRVVRWEHDGSLKV